MLRPLQGRKEITDDVTGGVAALNPRLIVVTPAGVGCRCIRFAGIVFPIGWSQHGFHVTLKHMQRRIFLQSGLAAACGTPLFAALRQERLDDAADVLARAVASGQVAAAVLHVTQRETSFTRHFGKAPTAEAMFLLGSISKPICMTALMTLFDRREFKLDDRLQKFLPKFTGEGRDEVTIGHLLTH